MPTLTLERDRLYWMMYDVLAVKQVSFPVSRYLYIRTTVSTQRMLEFPVKVSDGYDNSDWDKLQALYITIESNKILQVLGITEMLV